MSVAWALLHPALTLRAKSLALALPHPALALMLLALLPSLLLGHELITHQLDLFSIAGIFHCLSERTVFYGRALFIALRPLCFTSIFSYFFSFILFIFFFYTLL
jgi:hypothetical protein